MSAVIAIHNAIDMLQVSDYENPPLQRSDTSTFHPDVYECANCDSHFIPIIPLDENRCECCGVITYDANLVIKPNDK